MPITRGNPLNKDSPSKSAYPHRPSRLCPKHAYKFRTSGGKAVGQRRGLCGEYGRFATNLVGERHAAVSSQLRIPSQTPSQFPPLDRLPPVSCILTRRGPRVPCRELRSSTLGRAISLLREIPPRRAHGGSVRGRAAGPPSIATDEAYPAPRALCRHPRKPRRDPERATRNTRKGFPPSVVTI